MRPICNQVSIISRRQDERSVDDQKWKGSKVCKFVILGFLFLPEFGPFLSEFGPFLSEEVAEESNSFMTCFMSFLWGVP